MPLCDFTLGYQPVTTLKVASESWNSQLLASLSQKFQRYEFGLEVAIGEKWPIPVEKRGYRTSRGHDPVRTVIFRKPPKRHAVSALSPAAPQSILGWL
jgi:hypothetical protein